MEMLLTGAGPIALCACLSVLGEVAAYKRETACATKKPFLQCPDGERILVKEVTYSFDPKPCTNPSEDNNCTEKAQLDRELAEKCNGHGSCSDYYDPTSALAETKAGDWCRIGNTVYPNLLRKFNVKAITYDCQSDSFCSQVSRNGPGMSVVKTAYYPVPEARTSSACQCQFSAESREVQSFTAYVTCPSSIVHFYYETKSLGGSSTSMIERGSYDCKNVDDGAPFELASVSRHQSLMVTVDDEKSSERSAYSLMVTAIKLSGATDHNLPISMSCEGISIIFTRSEKIIIGTTLSVGVIIIIGIMIAGRIMWIRRKKHSTRSELTRTEVRASVEAVRPTSSTAALPTTRPDSGCQMIVAVPAESRTIEKTAVRQSGKKSATHAAELLRANPDNTELVKFATLLNKRRQQEVENVYNNRLPKIYAHRHMAMSDLRYSREFTYLPRPAASSLVRTAPVTVDDQASSAVLD